MKKPMFLTHAPYARIYDKTNDTSFDANTLSLSWSSASLNLTLNDPGPLLGTVSNVTVELETFLSSTNGQEAIFTGGDFSLRFDFDGTAGQTYGIEGPIVAMKFSVDSGPAFSTIDGEGQFDATTINLPGSNSWPATGRSSIDSLTLGLQIDLSDFLWDSTIGENGPSGSLQTQYSLVPDEVAFPEPTSLLLLGLGSLALLKRRRGA